jgi:hypothetical protein
MSGLVVLGAIGLALVVLWGITARIGKRHRLKSSHFQMMNQENDQLRHTVTEMAKERHHRDSKAR